MKKTTNTFPLNTENKPKKKAGKLLSAVTHLLLTLSVIFLISWYHAKTVENTLQNWRHVTQD